MAKSFFEEMGGTYHEENGYFIPDLTLAPEEGRLIGIWGQRHLRYIKEHRRLFYVNLLTSGKLNSYLAEINEQAEELFLRLVKKLAEKEGIMEELKSTDQMAWVGVINNIRARAREIVYTDIIALQTRHGILMPSLFSTCAVELFTNLWYNRFMSERQIEF